MARTVAIGHQDYETVRVNNYFYIDKTDFIREWWDSGDIVTLITRPRRFGKTLNMSMTEKFFSVDYAGRSDLFEGMKIWEEERFRELQGRYPVIFLTFAGVKDNNYLSARENICRIIEEIYNRFDFLTQGELLNEKEKESCLTSTFSGTGSSWSSITRPTTISFCWISRCQAWTE